MVFRNIFFFFNSTLSWFCKYFSVSTGRLYIIYTVYKRPVLYSPVICKRPVLYSTYYVEMKAEHNGEWLHCMAVIYINCIPACVWSLLSDSVYTWVEINAFIWFVKRGFHIILYLLMIIIYVNIYTCIYNLIHVYKLYTFII